MSILFSSVQFFFSSVQFIYLCLKHTYMQLIIKMQRNPAKGLWSVWHSAPDACKKIGKSQYYSSHAPHQARYVGPPLAYCWPPSTTLVKQWTNVRPTVSCLLCLVLIHTTKYQPQHSISACTLACNMVNYYVNRDPFTWLLCLPQYSYVCIHE